MIGLICLIFMGLLQISLIFSARAILSHAAARGARARTVGFNRWMVQKCVRAGAIPNAGTLVEPAFVNDDADLQAAVETMKPGPMWDWTVRTTPTSQQYDIERVRIPEYLGSDNPAAASSALDYEDWDTIGYTADATGVGDDATVAPEIHCTVYQNYPLTIPLHRTFYDADSLALSGESYIEQHYALYLNDRQW